PTTLWPAIEHKVKQHLSEMKMGVTEDFTNFINAVIDERSFEKITVYIEEAKGNADVSIVAGGNYDKTKGYFIEPTVLVVKDPGYRTMCEEIFGPVLSVYIYEPTEFEKMLQVVNTTSPYALTGSIFSKDRYVVEQAAHTLQNAAGNFYINDKPTGAVVGQQPFGGARASGTNDKAGSALNLYRWVSARTIKETFNPPKSYEYPFLQAE
ncbi:MAG: aldehyde dehydrogenase family protein, partial [Pedobacter sp.]